MKYEMVFKLLWHIRYEFDNVKLFFYIPLSYIFQDMTGNVKTNEGIAITFNTAGITTAKVISINSQMIHFAS